jgi:hypothetical protein
MNSNTETSSQRLTIAKVYNGILRTIFFVCNLASILLIVYAIVPAEGSEIIHIINFFIACLINRFLDDKFNNARLGNKFIMFVFSISIFFFVVAYILKI